MNSVKTLLLFHIKLEYRNYSNVLGLLLLMWIISYIIYRLSPQMEINTFNYLFWIVFLLLSVNITMRIENHQTDSEHLFFYSMVDPNDVIISRILFNFGYLGIISCAFYGFLYLYFSELDLFNLEYLGCLILGAFTISATLSFVTSIGRYAAGQNTIISILSMPLLIPVVLILYKLGTTISKGEEAEASSYLVLIGISLLSISLSLILFPFIWKR